MSWIIAAAAVIAVFILIAIWFVWHRRSKNRSQSPAQSNEKVEDLKKRLKSLGYLN